MFPVISQFSLTLRGMPGGGFIAGILIPLLFVLAQWPCRGGGRDQVMSGPLVGIVVLMGMIVQPLAVVMMPPVVGCAVLAEHSDLMCRPGADGGRMRPRSM